MPYKELTEICHANGILVVLDAAHALGQVAVDLTDSNIDFAVGNCYKWLFTPRGAGWMFCKEHLQTTLTPLVTWSSPCQQFKNVFHDKFYYCGTTDVTAWYTIEAALEFQQRLGGLVCYVEQYCYV